VLTVPGPPPRTSTAANARCGKWNDGDSVGPSSYSAVPMRTAGQSKRRVCSPALRRVSGRDDRPQLACRALLRGACASRQHDTDYPIQAKVYLRQLRQSNWYRFHTHCSAVPVGVPGVYGSPSVLIRHVVLIQLACGLAPREPTRARVMKGCPSLGHISSREAGAIQ